MGKIIIVFISIFLNANLIAMTAGPEIWGIAEENQIAVLLPPKKYANLSEFETSQQLFNAKKLLKTKYARRVKKFCEDCRNKRMKFNLKRYVGESNDNIPCFCGDNQRHKRHHHRRHIAILVALGAKPSQKFFEEAIWNEDYPMTYFLLQHGAKQFINESYSERRKTPIFFARNRWIAELLVNNGANVNLNLRNQCSLLMCVINVQKEKGKDLLQYYLSTPINIKAQDAYGDTVLHRLAESCSDYDAEVNYLIPKMELLLHAWVPLDVVNKQGKTAQTIIMRELSCDNERDNQRRNCLKCERCKRREEIVMRIYNERLRRQRINCWVAFIKANTLADKRLDGHFIPVDFGLPVPLPLEVLYIIKSQYQKIWLREKNGTLIYRYHLW